MMSSKKQASKIVMGVLVIVLVAMAAFIVLKRHSDSAANSGINYDDPNMAKTNEFVNEATASCLQKEADAGSDIPSCINNYKREPAKNSGASKSETAPTSSDLGQPASSPAVQSTPN